MIQLLTRFIRNLYETVAAFNFIYTYYDDDELKEVAYNLWVISGLKYRQRFEINLLEDNIAGRGKLMEEKKTIEDLKQAIFASSFYSSLDNEKQKVIHLAIRKKEFKVDMATNHAQLLSWTDVHKKLAWKSSFFDTTYNYFSLYSHPSNVSVFKYQNLFDRSTKAFEEISLLNLSYAFILSSIFIAEYIKVFPLTSDTFNSTRLLDQIVIDHYNMFGRGNDKTINHSFKALG